VTLMLTPAIALAQTKVKPGFNLFSPEQDVEVGRESAVQAEQQLPILRDAAVQDYVNRIGQSLARNAGGPNFQYQFRVVNAADINAFALPGGYVYVNRGVLSRASNESELASVLGHEIEHVVLRHSVKQVEHQQGAAIGVALACRLTRVCDSRLGQAAIEVGGAAVFARFSRADEVQADEGGLQNVMRVGIDPRGMLTFFEKLVAEEHGANGGLVASWFSDHPGTQDRIADVRRLLAQVPEAQLDSTRRDSPAFQSMKQAMSRLPAAPAAPETPSTP